MVQLVSVIHFVEGNWTGEEGCHSVSLFCRKGIYFLFFCF